MQKTVGIMEAYALYKDKKKARKEKPVEKAVYNTVVKMFFKYTKSLLFDNGDRIKLPFALGVFQIIGLRSNIEKTNAGWVRGLAPNWRATFKLWKEHPEYRNRKWIYFTNEHSDGIRYKFYWSREGVPYITKKARKFNLTYRARKQIYYNVMNDYTPYEIFDRISDVNKKYRKK